MFDFLKKLFDPAGFPPRWICGDWSAAHGWLHILSDLGIFSAYMAIPLTIIYYAKKRKDLPFPTILWLFAGFITFCGLTHLNEAIIFWHPIYRFAGVVKFLTAVVSWATVIALIRIVPKALDLPGLADINKRLSAEIEERKVTEEKFRLVVETSPNAIVIVNEAGKIAYFNAVAESIFGYTRGEALGKNIEILLPVEYRDTHPVLRQSFLSKPQVRTMGAGRDLFALRKDNTRFPVEVGLTPYQTDEGLMVQCSIIDITERLQAETRYKQVIETSPNGIIMVNSEGEIILFNKKAEGMFGYSREDVLGEPIELLIPERLRETHPTNRAFFMKDPKERAMGAGRDLFGLRKDGTEFPIEIGLTPIETENGLVVQSSIIDITERKRVQDQLTRQTIELLKANRDLKMRNKELDEFTYISSHDLQEPLRKLTTFSNMLKKDTADQTLSERAIKDIDIIEDASRRMQRLVQDLLKLSRAGRSELQKKQIPLLTCVQNAVYLLSTLIEENNAIITWDDLPEVYCDETLITQLYQNLITNAIKYRKEENPTLHLTVEEVDGQTVFGIKDNGIGIKEEYHAQIFTPFKRLHSRNTYDGSGIGLAICRKAVERHGGDIWVESNFGFGSHFKFTLSNSNEANR